MYASDSGGSDGKASAYNAEDPGSIPALGRPPGEGNDNPLQYFCLENPTDGGAWYTTACGVAKTRTRLSDYFQGICFDTTLKFMPSYLSPRVPTVCSLPASPLLPYR